MKYWKFLKQHQKFENQQLKGEKMNTVIFSIPTINCNHCIHTIQSEVGELEGVRSVIANVDLRNVEIIFEDPANEERIKTLLNEINYPVAENL